MIWPKARKNRKRFKKRKKKGEESTEIIVIHVIGHGRGWKEIIVMRGNFLVHWGGLQIRQN